MSSHRGRCTKPGNFIAKLPWRPKLKRAKRPHVNVKLENTEFYRRLLENGARDGKFNAELYQFFNDIAPIYLPLRYLQLNLI